MRKLADEVLKEFVEGCPTVPANGANTLIFDFLQWQEKMSKAAEEEDKKPKGNIKMTGGSKDTERFGVQTESKPQLSDEVVNKMIVDYEKKGLKIDVKDVSLVKLALKRQSPKENWNMLIRKYYDGFFPG